MYALGQLSRPMDMLLKYITHDLSLGLSSVLLESRKKKIAKACLLADRVLVYTVMRS